MNLRCGGISWEYYFLLQAPHVAASYRGQSKLQACCKQASSWWVFEVGMKALPRIHIVVSLRQWGPSKSLLQCNFAFICVECVLFNLSDRQTAKTWLLYQILRLELKQTAAILSLSHGLRDSKAYILEKTKILIFKEKWFFSKWRMYGNFNIICFLLLFIFQACAPRYIYYVYLSRKDPVGVCYIARKNFTEFQRLRPCVDPGNKVFQTVFLCPVSSNFLFFVVPL